MSNALVGRNVKVVDGQVWVRTPGKPWIEITSPGALGLGMDRPLFIETHFGDYCIEDLGVDVRTLSRLTGAVCFDPERAKQIWTAPASVRGTYIAIDFVQQQVVCVPRPGKDSPEIVRPFRSFSAIVLTAPPALVLRWPLMPGSPPRSLEGVSLTPVELSQRMGIPIVESHP